MQIISCITPTYNRKGLLKNAIESTLKQTYPYWEMIIVDDGSTDNTEQEVMEYTKIDNRIKYYKNPRKGANAARNYGINQAKGEYIVLLDDDDEHLPHRFESQLNALEKSNYNFILSGFSIKDLKNGDIISTNTQIPKAKGAGNGVRWMIKRDLLVKAGLFDEDFPAMQEAEISYRIAEFENYAFHHDIVMVGGTNHTSITRTKQKMIQGRIMLINKHENKMHPVEAAWWFYVIGMDYYNLGDKKNALLYLKRAADKDTRIIYPIAYFIFRFMYRIRILKRINLKILSLLEAYKFPILVEHQVIS